MSGTAAPWRAACRRALPISPSRYSPAVVNITTSTLIAQDTGPHPMVPEGSPFEEFFRDFLDRDGRATEPPQPGAPARWARAS